MLCCCDRKAIQRRVPIRKRNNTHTHARARTHDTRHTTLAFCFSRSPSLLRRRCAKMFTGGVGRCLACCITLHVPRHQHQAVCLTRAVSCPALLLPVDGLVPHGPASPRRAGACHEVGRRQDDANVLQTRRRCRHHDCARIPWRNFLKEQQAVDLLGACHDPVLLRRLHVVLRYVSTTPLPTHGPAEIRLRFACIKTTTHAIHRFTRRVLCASESHPTPPCRKEKGRLGHPSCMPTV